MKKAHLLLIGGLAATASVAVLGYRWYLNGIPVRIANQIRADVQLGRWDKLYDLTVVEEREKNGWTRDNFATFADHLTKHVKGHDFGGDFKEIALPQVNDPTLKLWNLSNERRFRWTVPFKMAVTGETRSWLDLTVLKDTDGEWKAMLGPFLRDISRSNRKDPNEHIRAMKDGLNAAGLTRYYNLIGDSELTVANLDRVLKGEIKRTAAWQKVEQ